jgi:AraC-like DNA-binding protein
MKSGLLAPAGGPREGFAFWTRPDGQLCLQHVRVAKNTLYRPHSHPEYGIVVCLKGEVAKTQLGTTHIIGPGEVLMSNSGIEHASSYLLGTKGCEAVCLTVERRALVGLLPGFKLPSLNEAASPIFTGKIKNRVLLDCALDVVRELETRDLGHELVIEGLATRLLIETLRTWPRAEVGSGKVDLTPSLPRRDFVRAYDFMRWCKKDAFRLHHLCRFLGSSEERFTRLFLAATHSTPAHFYNQLLMERARELLCEGTVAVKEISSELGFKTSSHFIVAFRRQFGLPPQEYRARHGRLRA